MTILPGIFMSKRDWRYERNNQNPSYIINI